MAISDVLAVCSIAHFSMPRPNIALDEVEIGASNRRETASLRTPMLVGCRATAIPLLILALRRGAASTRRWKTPWQGHRWSNEVWVAGVVHLPELKKPFQRMIDRGDKAVKAGRGVVLGFHGRTWSTGNWRRRTGWHPARAGRPLQIIGPGRRRDAGSDTVLGLAFPLPVLRSAWSRG